MNRMLWFLGLTGIALVVTVAARGFGPSEPRFEGRPLRHWAHLILEQPRAHRDLITRIGAPLTPVLVNVLRQPHEPWSPLIDTLRDGFLRATTPIPPGHLHTPLPGELATLNAIRALAYLGPPAAEATQALIPFLGDERFASDTAQALASIGPGAKQAVPQLAAALEDQLPWAATALGNIGEAAVSAIPQLEQALTNAIEDGPGWFRREVEHALEKIRPMGNGLAAGF